MELQIIATRDIASNTFGTPMFVPSLGGAIRAFGDECKRKPQPGETNILNLHPEDFELWHIGEWDDNNGTILTYDMKDRKQLACGANYRD